MIKLDDIDKKLLLVLSESPFSTQKDLVCSIHSGATDNVYLRRNVGALVKYRLGRLVEKGILQHNEENGSYHIEGATVGDGILYVESGAGQSQALNLGKTILLHHEEGTSIIFLCDQILST